MRARDRVIPFTVLIVAVAAGLVLAVPAATHEPDPAETIVGSDARPAPVDASAAARAPQEPADTTTPQEAADTTADEPGATRFAYEREVFAYAGTARRNPFEPLVGSNQLGPRIENLRLTGIIYDAGENSVAMLADNAGEIYRVRRGDVIGNARVVEIREREVRFAVDNLGVIEQETLRLGGSSPEGGQS